MGFPFIRASPLSGLPLCLGFPFVWASPLSGLPLCLGFPSGGSCPPCGLLRGTSLHLPLIRRLRDTFSHGRRLVCRLACLGLTLCLGFPSGGSCPPCGLLRGTFLYYAPHPSLTRHLLPRAKACLPSCPSWLPLCLGFHS